MANGQDVAAPSFSLDVETLRGLPADQQAALSDGVSALEAASAVGMSLADQDFDQFRAMGEWAGAASDSLRAAGIYGDVVEGDYSAAAAEVGEWMAEEALSEGFAEALERTVRDPGFDLRMGSPGAGAAWSGAVADVLSGQVMDVVTEPMDRERERVVIEVDTQHEADAINDFFHVRDTLAAGGLSEHGHFEELPNHWYPEEPSDLGRQDERPFASSLPTDVVGHMEDALNELGPEPVKGDIGFQLGVPPITREPTIDSFGDFARPMGGTEIGDTDAVHFDLDVGDRLGVDMRPDLEDHVMDYIYDAQVWDGRDIDFNTMAGPVEDTVEAAGVFQIQLRDREMEFPDADAAQRYSQLKLYNHDFDTGPLDASDTTGGAVLVGRDGGSHMGGAGDDLSLDASTARMGAGDDIVLLDNETGYLADGGAGDDILIGGARTETFTGGEGADMIAAGHGDTVIATAGKDKYDSLSFEGMDLAGPVSGKVGVHGEAYAFSEDGRSLHVTHDGRSVEIEGYSEGDFGIHMGGNHAALDAGVSFAEHTSLRDAVVYIAENRDSVQAELSDAREAGTASPQQQALAEVLDHPLAAQPFVALDAVDVDTLPCRIDPGCTVAQNFQALYSSARRELAERGLAADGTSLDAGIEGAQVEDAAPAHTPPMQNMEVQVTEYETDYGL